jgi:hypothetical protein
MFPNNDSAAYLFKAFKSDTNFYVYDSIPGVGYMYWPHKNINTFPKGQLPVGQGYQVYLQTGVNANLIVQGPPVDYADTPITLYGGGFANLIALPAPEVRFN